jgi:serine/threonine-protein kinase
MADSPSPLSAALADRYRIERELGAGGMATVWLAEDVKHHRKVAIKVLKADLSASVGAARFLREIEIAAQLQHPNILPLLDSGEAAGALYYVMPYVEGQSLRQRLARERELPIGEAVRILVEIVDALAYAHQHGVVHRDMKPDNVMLSGRHALVADFGVARALSEATGRNTLTSMGVALGTPTYMAPEQAVADPNVDQRADIYAVGVMAYELLAGRPPFTGVTPQQVLAAHVTEKPDPLSKHRPGVSGALEAIVMRCLEKRPADRWQSADDLLAALEPLATPSGGTAPTAARMPAVEIPVRPYPIARIAAAAVVLVALAVAWRFLRPSAAVLVLGKQEQLTVEPGLKIQPEISPDGKLVAYASGNFARMRIFIRPVGGGRTIPLSDDSTAVEASPRWSPDGSRLLFLSRGGVSSAPALGGSSRPLIPPSATAPVASAAWSSDGNEIAFVRADSLFVSKADGSSPRFLARIDDLSACSWNPRGRWIACVKDNREAQAPGSGFGNIAPSSIVLVPSAGGDSITVVQPSNANQSPVWSSDGGRLFFISDRDGTRDIYAVDISSSGRAAGAPTRLTTGLGATSLSISHDGRTLSYAAYSARSNLWALPIPQGATVSANGATPVTSGTQVIESVNVSRDGRWILYDSNLRGTAHAWRLALAGGQPEQLTNGPRDEFAPDLSPDGRSVTYHSWRTGSRDIEVKPLDGGEVERVTATPAQESYPTWSPDGKSILFYDQVSPTHIYTTAHEGPGKWSAPRLVMTGGTKPAWSPDGALVAFVRSPREEGAGAVAVVAPDGHGGRDLWVPASGESGAERARWSADGRTIYFKTHDARGRAGLWSLTASGGKPRLLVLFDDLSHPSSRSDFTVDARRFYFAIEDRQSDVYVADIIRK